MKITRCSSSLVPLHGALQSSSRTLAQRTQSTDRGSYRYKLISRPALAGVEPPCEDIVVIGDSTSFYPFGLLPSRGSGYLRRLSLDWRAVYGVFALPVMKRIGFGSEIYERSESAFGYCEGRKRDAVWHLAGSPGSAVCQSQRPDALPSRCPLASVRAGCSIRRLRRHSCVRVCRWRALGLAGRATKSNAN